MYHSSWYVAPFVFLAHFLQAARKHELDELPKVVRIVELGWVLWPSFLRVANKDPDLTSGKNRRPMKLLHAGVRLLLRSTGRSEVNALTASSWTHIFAFTHGSNLHLDLPLDCLGRE